MSRRSCLVPALLAALACAVTACGDDGDSGSADAALGPDASAPPDAAPAGPGLTIEGALIVNNSINSDAADTTSSRRTVRGALRVTRDGEPVTNAIVRVNPPQSFETYLTGEALDPSLYTGNYSGYFNDTVRVEISADDDNVPQTVLIGQPVYRITAPNAGETVAPGVDLVAQWSRPGAAADSLTVTTAGGHDSGALADDATYTIPGGDISLDTPSDQLQVLRCHRNDALPGDVAAGSYIDFCVDNRLPFTVAAP